MGTLDNFAYLNAKGRSDTTFYFSKMKVVEKSDDNNSFVCLVPCETSSGSEIRTYHVKRKEDGLCDFNRTDGFFRKLINFFVPKYRNSSSGELRQHYQGLASKIKDFSVTAPAQARAEVEQARTKIAQLRTGAEQARTEDKQARTEDKQARTEDKQARTEAAQARRNKGFFQPSIQRPSLQACSEIVTDVRSVRMIIDDLNQFADPSVSRTLIVIDGKALFQKSRFLAENTAEWSSGGELYCEIQEALATLHQKGQLVFVSDFSEQQMTQCLKGLRFDQYFHKQIGHCESYQRADRLESMMRDDVQQIIMIDCERSALESLQGTANNSGVSFRGYHVPKGANF